MVNVLKFLFILFFPITLFAQSFGPGFQSTEQILGKSAPDYNTADLEYQKFGPDFISTDEILDQYSEKHPTPCASEKFSNALRDHASEISENASESDVQVWAKYIMHEADVLKEVLDCDEIMSVSDETTIVFSPIVYEFPTGRKITIKYSTQKKVLKQLLMVASKPSSPTDKVSPKLMDPNDPAKYINTEPAWYAIMVVQHGSLSEFVGPEPNKNNVVSVKYINDNIDKIYPHGYHCTSRSAWANDSDTINQVVREVVDLEGEKDTNDYYVAGDINLEWVMYAEIALDVIITVATMGIGEGGLAMTKYLRSTRIAKNLKNLLKLDDVKKYRGIARTITQHTDDIAKLEKNVANAEKYQKTMRKVERVKGKGIPKGKGTKKNPLKGKEISKHLKNEKKIEKYNQELNTIYNEAKKIDPNITREMLSNPENLRNQQLALETSVRALKAEAEGLEKTSEAVANYSRNAEAFKDIMQYRRAFRNFTRKNTGNLFTRTLRLLFKSHTGAKKMDKAARIARAGMSSRSARIGDWLFQTTLKHGSRLAKFEATTGFFYGLVTFLGDMWDRTSATSKEFSNGIEFRPFCLLSADDIQGQENVVNYGMWLMWTGNSTDPADDDAAYLQAMDFASKFYYKLDEFQDKNGAECNVDIYVVRPIIRLDETNTNDPKGEMFYLFMNDIPWSTANQFGQQITNVEDWERTQRHLEETDPNGKYTKPETETNDGTPQA